MEGTPHLLLAGGSYKTGRSVIPRQGCQIKLLIPLFTILSPYLKALRMFRGAFRLMRPLFRRSLTYSYPSCYTFGIISQWEEKNHGLYRKPVYPERDG